MIKIDKKVPVPARKTSGKYPWKHMKIGDSFFVPKAHQAIAHNQAKRDGRKYQTAKEKNGIRIWRIK